MDLVKIGNNLRELRKENSLTQEQLAEMMGVARRTVSRWETGSNMPDLDILIELSDLYRVDLREILDGERKSETMDKELRETVLKVADYSNEEKERLMRRMHALMLAGVIAMAVFLVFVLLGPDKAPAYDAVSSFALGIASGTLIVGLIFTGRNAARIRSFKMRLLGRDGKGNE